MRGPQHHSRRMKIGHSCESVSHAARDMNLNHRLTLTSCTFKPESECLEVSERLCNGSSDQSGLEDFMSHCNKSEVDPEDDSRSLPSSTVEDEDDLTPEIQQAYGIFQCFLSEKHKATTAPFWHPIGPGSHGDQASDGEMCFKKMDDKFVNREYESITAFVADFRLMLENCYRFHGVHYWMSKQAQKLEVILEQKLTLLSRTLREKTTLAVTSGGRFGTEDEKAPAGTSSRRRSVPRNLAAITVGGSESIMVQALRLEELQRAKEEKRQRELERKEAEEVSAKELEDWERSLLSLAEPWSVHSMWELPAIGHFLCLAQTALNLPEIVFYELERCLLMPRCSSFLSKVMTSLLCPPHKRPTLQRRPALPYRKWEAELRRRVQGWYQAIGRAEDQVTRAEQLGLCHQLFWTVGETNPLEETPFHLLPFNQRVWLLKGLCDHVYETQKDVQDAVLGQPIHECRESILGYDGRENAYIHFPHFCGADLRIYCQSPCLPMEFPLLSFHVKRSEEEPRSEGSEVKEEVNEFQSVDGVKVEKDGSDNADVCAWDVKEDSAHGREEQKCSSSVQYTEGSGGVQQVEHLKEENDPSDGEPCFRVGDSCYKGKSPALDTRQNLQEKRPCTECSRASTQRCSHCHIWNRIQPEINRRRQDYSTDETMEMTCAKRKKRKSELNVRKTNTRKLNMKNKRMKKRLQRAANRMKKHKLRKVFDSKIVSLKRRTASSLLPLEPSFQLVCSSLDDLRRLISRTEEELDELNSTKKRSGRWPHKRSTVKELHITLIRLLNELLPWEPKLVKAFQKNRARLKKECEDFKKHPEYKNFTREQMDPADAEDGLCKDATQTTRELQDEVRTLKEDSEAAEHINELVNHKSRCPDHTPDVIMSDNETGPFTRASKRHHSAINEELSTLKKSKIDPESLSVEASSQTISNTQPSERSSVLSVRSFQGTYKPIQALLARSVGNKVTLINHPSAALIAQRPKEENTTSAPVPPVQPSATCSPTSRSDPVSTVTLTSETTSGSTGPLVYKTAGGVGLLKKGGASVKFSISHHKPEDKGTQQVVILPSNLLIQSTEINAASAPNTTAGFTENAVPVQQVAPLKDTSDVRTPSAAVLPTLRTLPTTAAGHKKTTEPNKPTTQTSKPDAKQELRTVCIRDSQSILVTTRGGNTGVVKVQTSEKNTLPSSPVFTISPQLQAFLLSKALTSTAQSAPDTLSAGCLPPITCQSKDLSSVSSVRTETSSVLNQTCGDSRSTLFTSKSPLSSTNTSSESVLITTKDMRNSVLKCASQQMTSHHSTLPKVFLVNPASNIPTTSTACTAPGSRVMLINHPSISNNSTAVIAKGASASESNVSPALKALNIIPDPKASFARAASGPVMNILTSRTLSTHMTDKSHVVSRSGENLLKTAADGKTLTFSTLGTGHMASSELLCVVKDASTASVLNVLNSKSGLGVGSSSFLGSLVNKHTTKPHMMSSPVTSHQSSVSSTVQTQTGSSYTSSPAAVRSVQEKIVINTSAPLAPGTQLLINNTRFVVPPQGLGAGSHVLLISQGSNPRLGSVPPRGPSVIQGMKAITPQQSLIRLPSPNTSSDRVCQSPSVLLKLTQPLHAGVSSSNVARLPVFHTSDGKGVVVQPSQSVSGCSTPVSLSRLLGTTSATILQSPQTQTPSVVPSVNTVISQNAPVVTRAPVSSTISRMQKLPVATVPPIGCPVTPVVTVPPSMNSVIKTSCQPIRALQPGAIGKHVVLPQRTQTQSTSAVQMTSGTSSKLLLSPDGAVLNIIQTSAKPVTVQMNHPIITTRGTVPVLNTDNPERH